VHWGGDDLSGGNESPSDPVVLRQTLQSQISVVIGISGPKRKVPGAVIALQRHIRCAEDGKVEVIIMCWT
jgi:hypothetical protein